MTAESLSTISNLITQTLIMSSTNLGYRLFSKAVHNDAMREDPPEIYGWRALVLAMSAGWGAMLFGMDSSMISGVVVLPSFLK